MPGYKYNAIDSEDSADDCSPENPLNGQGTVVVQIHYIPSFFAAAVSDDEWCGVVQERKNKSSVVQERINKSGVVQEKENKRRVEMKVGTQVFKTVLQSLKILSFTPLYRGGPATHLSCAHET